MIRHLGENGGVNSPPLSVEFQMTRDDLRAPMNKGTVKPATPIGRIIPILFGVIMLLAFALQPILLLRHPRHRYAASQQAPWESVAGLVIPLLFFACFWFFIMRFSQNKSAALPRLNQPTEVSLGEDSLVNLCGDYLYSVKWPSVERIEVGKTHLLVWTEALEAVVVPRRAFDSDEAFTRFADFARAQCEAAKPLTPPIAEV